LFDIDFFLEKEYLGKKVVFLLDEFDFILYYHNPIVFERIKAFVKCVSDKGTKSVYSVTCCGTYAVSMVLYENITQTCAVPAAAEGTLSSSVQHKVCINPSPMPITITHPLSINPPWNCSTVINVDAINHSQHIQFFREISENYNIYIDNSLVDYIYSRTTGHAGFEGSSAAKIVSLGSVKCSINLAEFQKHAESRYAPLEGAVENKIIDIIKQHVESDNNALTDEAKAINNSVKEFLLTFLEHGGHIPGSMLEHILRDNHNIRTKAIIKLQALGILSADKYKYGYSFTCPLILDVISKYYYPRIIPSNEQYALKEIDGCLLAPAIINGIKYFHQHIITDKLVANKYSFAEAIIQGELYAILRDLVAYPDYHVLCETRVTENRREAYDIWIKNGTEYGLELKVAAVSEEDIKDTIQQAIKYSQTRKPKEMYLINFYPDSSHIINPFPVNETALPTQSRFEVIHIAYNLDSKKACIVRQNSKIEVPFCVQ
jgi:hypothetical protein